MVARNLSGEAQNNHWQKLRWELSSVSAVGTALLRMLDYNAPDRTCFADAEVCGAVKKVVTGSCNSAVDNYVRLRESSTFKLLKSLLAPLGMRVRRCDSNSHRATYNWYKIQVCDKPPTEKN